MFVTKSCSVDARSSSLCHWTQRNPPISDGFLNFITLRIILMLSNCSQRGSFNLISHKSVLMLSCFHWWKKIFPFCFNFLIWCLVMVVRMWYSSWVSAQGSFYGHWKVENWDTVWESLANRLPTAGISPLGSELTSKQILADTSYATSLLPENQRASL